MAQAAAAAPAPRLSNSVVSIPTKFNGDWATYKSWVRSVNMYFAANPTFFAMDESKVLATLSYLEGGATTTFADLYYDQHLQQGILVPGTWQDFIDKLNNTFADLQLAMTAQMMIRNMKWNPNSQDPASFFSEFSLQAAHAGRPTSLTANNTVNIVDGMACIPPWFLSRMTAPTAVTTWSGFLTLVTNRYNFQKATGVLLRAPGGPAAPGQTYQNGSSTGPKAVTSPVVEQESLAPAEEAHIDEVNSEDFTNAQQ